MRNDSSHKKHKKPRKKIRFNAVTIWIVIEIIAALIVGAAAVVHTLYPGNRTTGRTYTNPSERQSDLTIDDIELPRDLYADDAVAAVQDEMVADDVTDAVDNEYSMSVVNTLSGMTLDRKIDSLLMTTPESLCDKPNVTVAGDVFSEKYNADPVAGLFFRDGNFKTEQSGRTMLATVRGWSRELTGMNVFIGYRGDVSDVKALSDKGINLCCISPDAGNASELSVAATEANMMPAYLADLSAIMDMEDQSGFYIAQSDDVSKIIEAINSGKLLMYMTNDHPAVKAGLTAAAEDGTIPPEVLDKAVGYAVTARTTLTQMRPEDSEVSP